MTPRTRTRLSESTTHRSALKHVDTAAPDLALLPFRYNSSCRSLTPEMDARPQPIVGASCRD